MIAQQGLPRQGFETVILREFVGDSFDCLSAVTLLGSTPRLLSKLGLLWMLFGYIANIAIDCCIAGEYFSATSPTLP